jgi:hypothetical protein
MIIKVHLREWKGKENADVGEMQIDTNLTLGMREALAEHFRIDFAYVVIQNIQFVTENTWIAFFDLR